MAKPNYRGNLYRKVLNIDGVKVAITAKTEKDLMKKIISKQVAIEKGEVILNKNTTVSHWAKQWLETYKKPKISKTTYRLINTILNNHILPVVGTMRLSQIKRIDLQKLLNNNAGKSFSYLSKLKIYLNELFENAERDELIKSNPAKFLELPESTKGITRVMTDDEYNATLEICKTHRAGLWIMLMLQCGLRKGETIPLTWNDVDFKNKLIKIDKAVYYVGNKAEIKNQPKTKAGIRVVGIPDELYNMLVLAKKESDKNTELIFTGVQTKGLLSHTQIIRMWNNYKRVLDIKLGAKTYRNEITESKIEGLHIHCLRHTCITRLLLAGADVKQVQVFAGHNDIKTTLNIYTHITSEQAAEYLKNYQKSVTIGVTNCENSEI